VGRHGVAGPEALTIDILQLPDAWKVAEGFPQPDWRIIGDYIRRTYPQTDQPEIWEEAYMQWLGALRHVLGPDVFQIYQSQNFLLLTAKSPPNANNDLSICESALVKVRQFLGDLACEWTGGRHAIIMFEDMDTYYRYISYFYPDEGNSEATAPYKGLFHSALLPRRNVPANLVREVTRLCLPRHRLPIWLYEGLAINIGNAITGAHEYQVNRDLAEEHEAWWNAETIQDFWSGRAFSDSDLSYSLAKILVDNMQGDYKEFYDFVKDANYTDAGEASAIAHLGDSLGLIASVFLGPGEWAPKPPALR
jgi:hypothetical protein